MIQIEVAAAMRTGPLSKANSCSRPDWIQTGSRCGTRPTLLNKEESGTASHCHVLDQVAACSLKRTIPSPIEDRQAMLKVKQIMLSSINVTNFVASRTSI